MIRLGTCGRCGGDVLQPELWSGVFPPQPKCIRCGAVPASDVVKMAQDASDRDVWTKFDDAKAKGEET